jgi:beta-galactosidase beta subunit
MVQIYFTKIKDDTCFAEGHRDHIDIQYITKGIEVIEVYSKDEVELVQEYDPKKYVLSFPKFCNTITKIVI